MIRLLIVFVVLMCTVELGKQAFSECCGINQLYLCYIRDQWMRQDEELLQLLCSIILRSASLLILYTHISVQ